MTIYNTPEEFGLEIVDSIDYSDGNYCFDYRVVWRRIEDGKLLSGRDSGCSCPSPFEDVSLKDLQEVESIGWLKEEIAKDGQNHLSAQDAAKFIEKIEAAIEEWLKRPRGLNRVAKTPENEPDKKDEEHYDKSWRIAALSDLEAAAYQITQALVSLKDESDYSAQVHGHSALEKVSSALGHMAAAVERKHV